MTTLDGRPNTALLIIDVPTATSSPTPMTAAP